MSISRNIIRRIHMGRMVPRLDETVREAVEAGDIEPKQLPTRRNLTRIDLPVKLELAARKVIQKHSSRAFREEVMSAKTTLYKYKQPDDKMSIEEKKRNIKTEIQLRNLDVKHAPLMHSGHIEDKAVGRRQMQELIDRKLEQKRRDWHFLQYDDRVSAVYMAARLAPNYATIKAVMDEIKLLDGDFRPSTVLDFGSGMGTTMWAVNQTWLNVTQEFLNVDISQSQNDLAEFLLRGGKESGPNIPGVFFRKYLPMSHLVKHNLVVAAFSLLDLPTLEYRINVIENLWHKTEDLLVIIERGTQDGFDCVAEARHFILNISGHDVAKRLKPSSELEPQLSVKKPNCHIMAPCSHEYVCPRLKMSSKQERNTCKFRIHYEPLEIGLKRGMITGEEFSYTILRKRPHPSYFEGIDSQPRWPRIIERRNKGTRQVTHKLCCPNGHLAEIVCTKKKHGAALYQVAKSCDWGDSLPITVDDEYVKSSDSSPSSQLQDTCDDESLRDKVIFNSDEDTCNRDKTKDDDIEKEGSA